MNWFSKGKNQEIPRNLEFNPARLSYKISGTTNMNMNLPQSPEFESLLRSLHSLPPDEDGDWIEETLIPEEVVMNGSGFEKHPGIKIWYRQEGKLTIRALLRKIQDELERSGHRANESLARIVLGFFAHTKASTSSSVEKFNQLFDHLTSADLNQYFIFSLLAPPAYRFQVGPFTVGPFRASRLAYHCEKARSDFFERYEGTLRTLPLSVERDHLRIKVIYWHKLAAPTGPWSLRAGVSPEFGGRLGDLYFSQLSNIYFEKFFDELYNEQEIGIALGSGWFDPLELKALIGASRVSVFLNIGDGREGFVSPMSTPILEVNLGGAHLGIPTTGQALKTHFGFERFSDCEIPQMMRSYFHFLALAAMRHHAGRHAEGFLHGIIAIDLLLGEKSTTTQSVTKRSAALTYRGRGKPMVEAIDECDRIYDARSRYVHGGKPPEEVLWPIATEITREIAFCLMRLQMNPANCTPGFRDRWVKEIDFLTAALQAGRDLAPADFAAIGVQSKSDFGLSDYRAILGNRDSNASMEERGL